MSDNITPLNTEHLRIMRDDIAQFRSEITKDVKEGFADIRKRMTHVEHSILGLKRDEVDTATEITEHRQMFDKLQNTIDDLKQRLEKVEARTAQ